MSTPGTTQSPAARHRVANGSAEAASEQLVDQLRNGIVRMSHAASGLDEELDAKLGALRKKIRSTSSAPVVEALVAEVSKAILAVDAKSRRTKEQNAALGTRLLAALDPLKPGWQLRRKRKTLANGLRSKNSDLQKFLKEYGELLTASIRSAGLGVDEKAAPAKGGTARAAAAADPATDVLEHCRNTLLVIANHLESDLTDMEVLNGLRKDLAQVLELDALPDLLDTLAELAGTAREEEQKRFEEFVQHMAEQFQELEGVINANVESEQEAFEGREQFRSAMEASTQSVTTAIARSTNLKQLQTAVSREVEEISGNLTRFAEADSIRQKKFEASISLLQEKLGEAHTECNELYSEISHLRVKTQLDPLTGLPNRAGFMERAQHEFERATRYGNRLSLAVADIDRFKLVNDRYGHKAGDTVITEVGSIIAASLRKSDFVCRYGGEEFVVLLPETTGEQAQAVAEKIREAVSECPFAFRDRRVQITISVGVAELEATQSISDLVEKADVALYAAKAAGRNRTMNSFAH
ncbi:MAG: diguanylate cyclase [Pseudomonadota bacterium]